jgi:hypothetical protein
VWCCRGAARGTYLCFRLIIIQVLSVTIFQNCRYLIALLSLWFRCGWLLFTRKRRHILRLLSIEVVPLEVSITLYKKYTKQEGHSN